MVMNLEIFPWFKQAPSNFKHILVPLKINPAARVLSDVVGSLNFFQQPLVMAS